MVSKTRLQVSVEWFSGGCWDNMILISSTIYIYSRFMEGVLGVSNDFCSGLAIRSTEDIYTDRAKESE
jgi:hypothetical protein